MDWEIYKKSFADSAKKAGYDEEYIDTCLIYAQRLISKDLPVIYSPNHLAMLVGTDHSYLRQVAYKQSGFYRHFKIPKRSGSLREISEPLPNLKKIQRFILDNILYAVPISPHAKAFVPGKSIKENARFHRGQEMVLTVDIKDFFSSLTAKLVQRFFCQCGYSKKLSYYLTRLCTLDGSLPQGAPSSPALANILVKNFDIEIAAFCKSKSIRYTRYADDLTFSGQLNISELLRLIYSKLSKLGLQLNDSKTRLMLGHQRQEVTGVVVNQKLQVPRNYRRNLRQSIYYIEKYGLDNHLAKIGEIRANYSAHIRGQANFVLFINPADRDAIKALKVLKTDYEHLD